MTTRIALCFGLSLLLGSLADCGSGNLEGAGADGGSCSASYISPGGSCQQGIGCPADTQGAGYGGSPRATCDCVGATWRCTFLDCPTVHAFDAPPTNWCGADVVFPAMCSCHTETNPQQGESYCVCSASSGDSGAD